MIIIVKCESKSAHLKSATRLVTRSRRAFIPNFLQTSSVLIGERPDHGCGQGIPQENPMRFDHAPRRFYTRAHHRTVSI
ncbi:ATPase component [Pseudomonas syringae pv. actinidiae]|uniref:ATPase component n=1 Tax=Pseudomonas syringae pv. actinidiae TaxID=103796 RepID=A0A2V0QLJ1_PSESF|nr:ATPase component [Pseudomonas syringae pv. actinidiae]